MPRHKAGPAVIAHAYRWHEAQLAAAALRAAGLPAEIRDGHTGALMPHAGIALGGFRLIVPASRRDEALAMLAGLPPPRATQPLWLGCVLAFLVWWGGIGGMAGMPPMMSGLYLQGKARGPAG
ncbi:hypothetical protein [Paracoccus sp. DMF]|uniref:hypothetical protein n=1 Tax=Paracoccus sp. DMF TaxID=400837 RepID=UPI0021E4AA75|nr:hypothetical protein [Paracoccus sp. DMF]